MLSGKVLPFDDRALDSRNALTRHFAAPSRATGTRNHRPKVVARKNPVLRRQIFVSQQESRQPRPSGGVYTTLAQLPRAGIVSGYRVIRPKTAAKAEQLQPPPRRLRGFKRGADYVSRPQRR
jgi:hypothetical protein